MTGDRRPLDAEFERPEVTDRELERADEATTWERDWLELHGDALVHPSFADALRQESKAKRAAAEWSARLLADVSDHATWSDRDEGDT